jgi:hypothetical protein
MTASTPEPAPVRFGQDAPVVFTPLSMELKPFYRRNRLKALTLHQASYNRPPLPRGVRIKIAQLAKRAVTHSASDARQPG